MGLILKLLKNILIIGLTLVGLVLGLNFWMVLSTQGRIYYSVSELPPKKVALLLGTSKRTAQGGTNKYFKERMQAAADLYHRGVIRHLIVSGDNQTVYYNEPRDMLNALKALGVPESVITLDYAGLRTLDSVVRAKMIFGQDELLIITQDFHCYRALFIADFYDIDAVAYSADHKDPLPTSLAIREILARAGAVVDLYVLNRNPKVLGKEQKIN